MPAGHKLHSNHDRTPDQEQTAVALADHEHVRPGLARQASQRSANAQREASSAALVQSVQSSSQGSSQVAQQPQRAIYSQQKLLKVKSKQPQRVEDEGHEMDLWDTQNESNTLESQPQRAQQDAQLDKQAQHAQHSMHSGCTSSMTLSARVRQRSSSPQSGHSITSSCSAVLHSPEATTQVSFHASVSPGRLAMPSVDSREQLLIKASVSAGQQQRLPEQLHNHSLPQQLPQQRLQLQSGSGPEHLLTTHHKGHIPDFQGQSQQECVFLQGRTTGTGQVRGLSRTNSITPSSGVPQADAAATTAAAATATCQPHVQSRPVEGPGAEGPGAAEQASAGAEDSGSQHQPGSRSDSAEAGSQGPGVVDNRQQEVVSTKPAQLSASDAAATCAQTQMLSSCGDLKGPGQPVSRTGSMDQLQKLMLLTSGAQLEQHQVSGPGALSITRSVSRTASMAVQHTSSSDSAGGPQGKSSQTQGSPQKGVLRTGSITSQPQLPLSRAASASSWPLLGIVDSGTPQQGVVLRQPETSPRGGVATSQPAESHAEELLLSQQQSVSRSTGTSSSQQLTVPATGARTAMSQECSGSSTRGTQQAASYARGSQPHQLQHRLSSPGSQNSTQQPTLRTCCSNSNGAQQAQQAVSHARGIALLQEQSQVALGVQPSYDDLSREGLEEDNCRLRCALAAIELQLGVLRNQQVGRKAPTRMRYTVCGFLNATASYACRKTSSMRLTVRPCLVLLRQPFKLM